MLITMILITVLVLVAMWVIESIKIIGPDEMAVFVVFGVPVDVWDSGPHFVPWAFGLIYLKRYPKKTYNLEYKGIDVLTKKGRYPDQDGAEVYGAVSIMVDAAEYLNFPRPDTPVEEKKTHPLIRTLRAGIPIDEDGLREWTREAVENAVRLAFGQITWRQAAEELKRVNNLVAEVFRDVDGAIVKAGFSSGHIKLAISKIQLPKELEVALVGPEKTRLQAEAATKDAEAQAIDRLGTILQVIALSEGITLEDVKKRGKDDKKLGARLLGYAMKLHAEIEKADRGAFFQLESSGQNPFLDMIALWRQMTGGGGKNPPASGGGLPLAPPPRGRQ